MYLPGDCLDLASISCTLENGALAWAATRNGTRAIMLTGSNDLTGSNGGCGPKIELTLGVPPPNSTV
ncbi:hypothetical protein D3C72_2472380 [compost metagenome]